MIPREKNGRARQSLQLIADKLEIFIGHAVIVEEVAND